MALFLDGPAPTIDDLINEDSGLLDTALTVGINVTAKLQLAWCEVQSELETLLLRLQSAAAIGLIQPPSIGQVVVTPDLARWEKMQALAMVYRDASYTQLIDRYKNKWDMFVKLTQAARDQFIANGIGLVSSPLPIATIPILGTVSVTSTQSTAERSTRALPGSTQQARKTHRHPPRSIVVPDGKPDDRNGYWRRPPTQSDLTFMSGTVLAMMTLQNSVALPVNGTFAHLHSGTSAGSQLARRRAGAGLREGTPGDYHAGLTARLTQKGEYDGRIYRNTGGAGCRAALTNTTTWRECAYHVHRRERFDAESCRSPFHRDAEREPGNRGTLRSGAVPGAACLLR